MSKITKVKLNKVVDLENFTNSSTGETLLSELQNAIIEVKEDSGQVVIDYDEYVTIDSKAIKYCWEHLSIEEFGRLNIITDSTYTSYNIICSTNKTPYNENTLPPFLKLSKDRCIKFIRKLKKLGIIYTLNGLFMGKVQTVYMLNPYLSKKRKTTNSEMLIYFQPLSLK